MLAFLAAVTVIVDVPFPLAIDEGLNPTLSPPPGFAESDTLELKPFEGVTLMVEVPELLRRTVKLDGLAETAKSGTGAVEVTVTETEVLCVSVPLVPVMVTM